MRAGLDLQQYLYNLEHYLGLQCNTGTHWSKSRATRIMHMQMKWTDCVFQKGGKIFGKQVRGRSSFTLSISKPKYTVKPCIKVHLIFIHIFG